jgi:N-formylglutamate deformylase
VKPADDRAFLVERGPGPLISSALHASHALRAELAPRLAVSAADRLREEDPHTEALAAFAPNRLVALRSRFEVDLNRPRGRAVYRVPADAWGLEVWREPPTEELVERSLRQWDDFYQAAESLVAEVIAREGHALVLDIHAYCHRRGGPWAPPEDPAANPEVDLDTGPLDRPRWARVVEALQADFSGAGLDARENVKFRGGHFVAWLNRRFSPGCCAVAIEFRKSYVDEWSGVLDPARLARLAAALSSAASSALREFQRG